jgi:hypothetical protein
MPINQYVLSIGVLLLLATIIMAHAYDQGAGKSYLGEPQFRVRDFIQGLMKKRVFRPSNPRYNFDQTVLHMTTTVR